MKGLLGWAVLSVFVGSLALGCAQEKPQEQDPSVIQQQLDKAEKVANKAVDIQKENIDKAAKKADEKVTEEGK
ncbi:MAG: hypothetical protein V2A74_11955 [bacterium]